jgi:hypothetical protein
VYPSLCPLVFAIAVVCVRFVYLRLVVSFRNNTFLFYRGRLVPRPIPNMEGQGIPPWVISFDLSGMGGPASSYTNASISLWIIWPRKPGGGVVSSATHYHFIAKILPRPLSVPLRRANSSCASSAVLSIHRTNEDCLPIYRGFRFRNSCGRQDTFIIFKFIAVCTPCHIPHATWRL